MRIQVDRRQTFPRKYEVSQVNVEKYETDFEQVRNGMGMAITKTKKEQKDFKVSSVILMYQKNPKDGPNGRANRGTLPEFPISIVTQHQNN